MLFVRRARSLNLANVLLNMLGMKTEHIEHRHPTPLLMLSRARENFFGLIFQELVIFAAQPTESLNRLRNLSLLIIEIRSPLVLIPRDQRWIILGNHLAKTHHIDSFCIRKMADDCAHAPFAFGG